MANYWVAVPFGTNTRPLVSVNIAVHYDALTFIRKQDSIQHAVVNSHVSEFWHRTGPANHNPRAAIRRDVAVFDYSVAISDHYCGRPLLVLNKTLEPTHPCADREITDGRPGRYDLNATSLRTLDRCGVRVLIANECYLFLDTYDLMIDAGADHNRRACRRSSNSRVDGLVLTISTV